MGAEIISNAANNIKSGEVYSCMPLPDEEPQSILEFVFFAVDSSDRVAVNEVPQGVWVVTRDVYFFSLESRCPFKVPFIDSLGLSTVPCFSTSPSHITAVPESVSFCKNSHHIGLGLP